MRNAQLEIQYEEYRASEVKRFVTKILPSNEYKQLFDQLRRVNQPLFRSMTDEQLDDLTHRTVRAELEKNGRIQMFSFEEFCQSISERIGQNPDR